MIDASTGTEVLYQPSRHYPAAGFTRADILAALIYQHQVAKTALSSAEAGLTAQMMEDGSHAAANSLWRAIGGGRGLSAANQALGLRQTRSAGLTRWEQISTTVPDELRLLADLTSAGSPLTPAWRDYELGQMAQVAPGWAWGISSAATGRTGYAVASGAVRHQGRWIIDSLGVVQRDGRELLIAVELAGDRARPGGIAVVESAAVAAAGVITGSGH